MEMGGIAKFRKANFVYPFQLAEVFFNRHPKASQYILDSIIFKKVNQPSWGGLQKNSLPLK